MASPFPPALLHPLLDAVDAAIELIDALAIILRLSGRSLGLSLRRLRPCQCGFGGAVRLLQLCLKRIDTGAHGRDLLANEILGGAAAQAERADQNHSGRGNLRYKRGHGTLQIVNARAIRRCGVMFHPCYGGLCIGWGEMMLCPDKGSDVKDENIVTETCPWAPRAPTAACSDSCLRFLEVSVRRL